MLLLKREDVETLAPLIGKVVMYYSVFENELDELEIILEHILTQTQPGWKRRKSASKIYEKLKKISDGFTILSNELAQDMLSLKDAIVRISDARHHVIHGEWWSWRDTPVQTSKRSLKTGEMEYKEWSTFELERLIDQIGEVEAEIFNILDATKEMYSFILDTI